ncbi:GNAT family N-acetyltransferase [Microbispora hainanensis]|uniref:GNAT family N-acetyltransferase n=1 Tax=Microbispora hainanensis TaxID=568844 RepID=A0ABZ1SM38_9ACTN|nr:GNAT family N-acetyltransferase [Microbispora hainanensis]
MAEPIVRPAAGADMAGVRAVAGHFGLLDLWPERPDFVDAEREFGEVLVGEVDGTIAGFGGTLRRGTVTHLGDLFVLPGHQSSRLGRTILSRLLPAGTPKVTFASADRRALALYIRHGMRPRCPLFYLTRRPPGDQETPEDADFPASGVADMRAADGGVAPGGADFRVPGAADVGVVPGNADPQMPGVANARTAPGDADVHAAAVLDAHVSGGDRTSTLTWYAGLPGVTLHVSDSGYAFARTAGDQVVIGPAGGVTPQDCADIVLEAANAHHRTAPIHGPVHGPDHKPVHAPGCLPGPAPVHGPGRMPGRMPIHVAVPGAHPLLALLLEDGWRIGDMDTLMTSEDVMRLDCYIPHPDLG